MRAASESPRDRTRLRPSWALIAMAGCLRLAASRAHENACERARYLCSAAGACWLTRRRCARSDRAKRSRGWAGPDDPDRGIAMARVRAGGRSHSAGRLGWRLQEPSKRSLLLSRERRAADRSRTIERRRDAAPLANTRCALDFGQRPALRTARYFRLSSVAIHRPSELPAMRGLVSSRASISRSASSTRSLTVKGRGAGALSEGGRGDHRVVWLKQRRHAVRCGCEIPSACGRTSDSWSATAVIVSPRCSGMAPARMPGAWASPRTRNFASLRPAGGGGPTVRPAGPGRS